MRKFDDKLDKSNQITISYNKISTRFILEYGKESLLILALISRHYTIRKQLVFNLRYVYESLKIPLNNKRRKMSIVQSINKMFNTDFNDNKNINSLILVDYNAKADQFLLLTDKEVDRLLGCASRVDKYNLFNVYVVIKRYINKDTGFSYPSISKIMEITNIRSNNTIINYINILVELKMLECERSMDYITTSNGIRRPNNKYKIAKERL